MNIVQLIFLHIIIQNGKWKSMLYSSAPIKMFGKLLSKTYSSTLNLSYLSLYVLGRYNTMSLYQDTFIFNRGI